MSLGGKQAAPPQPAPQPAMPAPVTPAVDLSALDAAKQAATQKIQQRSGRASTMLIARRAAAANTSPGQVGSTQTLGG